MCGFFDKQKKPTFNQENCNKAGSYHFDNINLIINE